MTYLSIVWLRERPCHYTKYIYEISALTSGINMLYENKWIPSKPPPESPNATFKNSAHRIRNYDSSMPIVNLSAQQGHRN